MANFTGRQANVISGPAPLCVHFDAGLDQDLADPDGGFVDYHYEWDFDDAGAGDWITGRSKETDRGPIVAHVFENAGTHNVVLNVYNSSGLVDTWSPTITVSDPDTYFSTTNTVCINPAADSDFTGAPTGSTQVQTDDLSTITSYAISGRRLLFKRGSSWSTSGLTTWPTNNGVVHIGAYGTGNKPQITVTGGSFLPLDTKQNWTIMDLYFYDGTGSYGIFGGASDFQRMTMLRLESEGFSTAIGWTHWNTANLVELAEIAIVECDVLNVDDYCFYAGSERIMILGNDCANSSQTHICRVWQAYKGVVAHNRFSGSSLDSIGYWFNTSSLYTYTSIPIITIAAIEYIIL